MINSLSTRLSELIGVMFDPAFWFAGEEISHEWSAALDLILDKVIAGEATIRRRSSFWLVIGDCPPIWIANYPFAYGNTDCGPMPTRRVRKKLAAVVAAFDAQRAIDSQNPQFKH